MSRRNECLDVVLKALAQAGIKPTIEKMNGGTSHFRVSWIANGRRRSKVLTRCKTEWRAMHNNRAEVRRMLREDGLLR